LGRFRSTGGRHRLDIDVLSDTDILNTGNPHLIVKADRSGYDCIGRWSALMPIVAGILVLIIGGVTLLASLSQLRSKREAERSAALSIFAAPGAGQRGAGYLRQFPRRVLFTGVPSFALIAISLLMVVLFVLWIIGPLLPQGIRVLTSRPSRLTPRYGPGSKPLTLRIDKQRHWFFEGQPVSPEEFPAALQEALKRRPDPFVCVDADPDLDYQVPVRAMDTIQGLFVKIIVATPNAKDDGCTATIGR
jgi:biopolymer transport protein ExbD